MADDQPHKGHRERFRQRYLNEDLDKFEPHNLFELLLFYGIPRADTNVIAHDLVNRFGGINKVFDAPIDELVEVKGISENAALLIKLIPSLCRVYMKDEIGESPILDSVEKMGKYCVAHFAGRVTEFVYLICLDNSSRVISCDFLVEGTVNTANISIRKITDFVVRYKASHVILTHNHPSGFAIPSNNDVVTTVDVKNSLKQLGIELLDHIIVAKSHYTSLAEQGYIV